VKPYIRKFTEDKETDNAYLALQYIMQRHAGNVKSAKETMSKLKKNLGDKAYNYLKKFGDPDASGKYNDVKSKWENYAKEVTPKQKESSFQEASLNRNRYVGDISPMFAEEGLYEVFVRPDPRREGYFIVTAFSGKSSKPNFNYTYPNMAKAGEKVDGFIKQIKEFKARKEKAKADSKVKAKVQLENIKVGDIFYSSWGYDQTNIDFYQIVEKKAGSAVAREIGQKIVSGSEGFMSETVIPDKDNFTGPAFPVRVNEYGIVGKYIHHGAYLYDKGDGGLYQSHYA
jgi:hypothetical protein